MECLQKDRTKKSPFPPLSAAQYEELVALVEMYQEAKVELLARERALTMLRGKVTLEMIRVSNGEVLLEYRGCPVTADQMRILAPNLEAEAHHRGAPRGYPYGQKL